MISIDQALAIATQRHQAGQLAEAERIYRQILQVDPRHPYALNQLGMLALQSKHFEAAVELIALAIQCDRSQASFHANLAEAYRHLKQFPKAIECCRTALKLQPGLAQVHVKLGNLLQAEGDLVAAAASLRTALKLKPDDNETRTLLGRVLQDQHSLPGAEMCFRRVLCASNASPDAHLDLASVLQAQGKMSEAISEYEAAIELQPGNVVANLNLGGLHGTAGRFAAAYAAFKVALAGDPNLAEGHTGLGSVFLNTARTEEAIACFREALRIDPQYVPAHINLGLAWQYVGNFPMAVTCYQDALRIDPTQPEAHNNIGICYMEQDRREEAVKSIRRAIELRPDFSLAYSNLGAALPALGGLDEAIACHRKSLELRPDAPDQHSNLLYAINFQPAYDVRSIFAEHREWGKRHADPMTLKSSPHVRDRLLNRRIRVGYVSAHFRAHAVNFFSEPILAAHDHDQFEVFCYSNSMHTDETTTRLQGYADHWREIFALDDDHTNQLIRQDEIDILVDLTGHIAGNRMMLFARRPAPVQVTYIGYQNTTGMLAMDYRLTDEYSDPPGTTDAFYTETLVRLPRTFFCYLPSSDAPPVAPPPVLKNGTITFASLNSASKITPQLVACWTRLLAAVPRSRLIVLGEINETFSQFLGKIFSAGGVGPERWELAERRPRLDYLEMMSKVDIALDPFPFNGHTTTCDCLWQGLPVVTLSGQTYASRFGGSALATLGLTDLIASTPEQYIQIAADLAGNVARLQQLRDSLRELMTASPLLDFQTFTRNLEAEYRRMWTHWCETADRH